MKMTAGRDMTIARRDMMKGRERAPLGQEIWDQIDQAVHAECERTEVAAKLLPMYGPIDAVATTVPSDTIVAGTEMMEVDETATVPIVEIQRFFRLTRQQIANESERMTAVTLATRCANLVCQAKDVLIFQGERAALKHPVFASHGVTLKSGRMPRGLITDQPSAGQKVSVRALARVNEAGGHPRWGEETFAAVAAAYSRLQGGGEGLLQAHYGPYCLVLHHQPYADSYAPLPSTLIMPADRIKPLVNGCFHGTGTVPPFRGALISTGGNTVDLVVAQAPTTEYVQDERDANVVFRVYTRFALRIKDPSAVIVLHFDEQGPATGGERARSDERKS